MRRLVVLVGAIVLVDTIFYAALAPMLPSLRDQFGLSKGDAGILVASYAVGTLLGSLPAGWAVARVGARRVLLGGLLVMSTAGVLFAFLGTFELLVGARFVQGLGGACSWTAGLALLAQRASRARRGRVLGSAIGAGIFGAQLGPVLGAAAEQFGRGPAFGTMAVVGLGLAAWALTLPRPTGHEETRTTTLRTALRDRRFLAALWVTLLPSISFGVIEVLAPLDLDRLGASGTAIAAVFFAAALVEAIISPLTGRWADRHGMRGLLRVALLSAAAGLAALTLPQSAAVLALVMVLTAGALGMLWTPGGSLVSLAADRLQLDQGYAFAINNIGWSGGMAAGSGVGGVLGQVAGDALPYGLAAALCLGTAAVFWRGRQVPSVPSRA